MKHLALGADCDEEGCFGGDGVAVLERDARTGVLHQRSGPAGCLTSNAYANCREVNVFANPARLAISPDGLNLYVGSAGDDFWGGPGLVTPLKRDPRTGVVSAIRGRRGCHGRCRAVLAHCRHR